MTTRTAFVLAGGGSLGAVQVGMLQALGEAGIEPDLLVGTSAGAVNAAWVAGHGTSADSLAELADLWTRVRRQDIFPVTARMLLRAVAGRSRAVSSGDALAALVRTHAGVRRLEDATVPVQLMATDILSGLPVVLDHGPVDTAVRASAAVPGVFPPVLTGGRWLVDGGVAHAAGIGQAVAAGATTVHVVPTGYPCALPRPPATPLGMALHALTLLVEQRLVTEVAALSGTVTIRVLPPLCPLAISAADFDHAAELTRRGREATRRWLDGGGSERPHQEQLLSFHGHEELSEKLSP
ncbi:patatin-like phospholipase family protein [Nocardioides marmoribigeumensis]|uniref:NTE family protein n=1 Tax=Nocardioides marmoribigeumensis TaxID=433649 RepID=A0ABU2BTG5_9ACTN|nr:patatin-like phospholipase family protein [Nocardioides marmoribigeumensis]MDR7361920.1 NTE family protein [Nocardioides marmoribigeumensis]